MRLLQIIQLGSREAKIYKDSDTNEFVTKFYIDGSHQTEADYFTNDRGDAVGTGDLFVKTNVNEHAGA